MLTDRRSILIAMGVGVGTVAIDGVAAAATDDFSGFGYDLITDWLSDVTLVTFDVSSAGLQPIYKNTKDRKNFDKQYLIKLIEYTKGEISKKKALGHVKVRDIVGPANLIGTGVSIGTRITLKETLGRECIGAYSMDIEKYISFGYAKKNTGGFSTQPIPFNFTVKESGNVDALVDLIFNQSLKPIRYVFDLLSVGN